MIRRIVWILVAVAVGGIAIGSAGREPKVESPVLLAPVTAEGMSIDTLLLGGYANGDFGEALDRLASDLTREERTLVGQHLGRIFGDALPHGLAATGRLRIAYERALRPDGTTRSIRVLGAEVAVSGRVHTAYYFERGGQPGYFDPLGRSLDRGGWGFPIASPRVSSPFGRSRMHPILDRILPHTGVDFAAPTGEPVIAAADGIVVAVDVQGGFGLSIEIRHSNGYSTRYAHLSALAEGIAASRMVRRGQVIGHVGQSGLATGPHLHFEVRRRGTPVDPMTLAVAEGPDTLLGGDPDWMAGRLEVGALLARAPAVARPAESGTRVGS